MMKILSFVFLVSLFVHLVYLQGLNNLTEGTGQSSRKMVLVIDVSTSHQITQPHFISVNIDSNTIRYKMEGFEYSSKKLRTLAAAMSPTYIRFGGTYADFLHFDPDGKDSSSDMTLEKLEAQSVEDSGFFEEVVTRKNFKNKTLPGSNVREKRSEKKKPGGKDNKKNRGQGKGKKKNKGQGKGKKKSPGQGQPQKRRVPFKNETLPGSRWDNMTRFCDDVKWDIMWDFNLFFWKNGLWDPTDAKRFLNYSASRGVRIPAFQLGNEPNAFKHNFNFSIEPPVLAKDHKILQDVIAEYPQYSASGIYGPECTNLDKHGSSRQYLMKFLASGGCDAITEVGLHHYYLNGKTATVKDFLDPTVMDGLKLQLDYAYNITWENCRVRRPIRLTETSSAYGGGADGLSNGYVAGFLWLDKLGICAKYGVTHVFRQTFFGGKYALVDMDLNPLPDFFLTLLYKRLIVGPVFNVITTDVSPLLRLYAHCACKSFYNYPDGALVVYYLYMGTEEARLTLDQYQNSGMHLFILTAGDSAGMKSKKVKLNDVLLEMKKDELPEMKPKPHVGDIPLKKQSFGFIVIPNAEVRLCKNYHRSRDVRRRK